MSPTYLPFEWQDEERMRILMRPMPPSKDFVAFNSRITFWTSSLFNWSKAKESLTFTLHDGEMAFRRGTQVPMCLPQIFQHLIKNRELINIEELVKPPDEEQSWLAWSKSIVVTPSLWAWSIIQDTISGKGLDNKVFINQKILEERAEDLLRIYWTTPRCNLSFNPEDVITVEELYRCTSAISSLSLEDMNLVLHYLAKKQRVAIRMNQGKSLIKLAKPGQTQPIYFSDTELAECELRETEKELKKRIDLLERESSELRVEAKRTLTSGLKNEAMSCLRRKKRCHKSIETTLSALENVSQCLQQIEDSKLNMKILDSFQLGVNALKSSIAASGGTDGVYKEMDSVQETLDECRDITDTMAFGVQSPEQQDDTNLEQELEELMARVPINSPVRTPASAVSEELTLPNVPRSDPLKKYRTEEVTMT